MMPDEHAPLTADDMQQMRWALASGRSVSLPPDTAARLQARVAELEDIARAVARFDDDDSDDGAYKCHWCSWSFFVGDGADTHAATCPVARARALLGEES